MAKPLKPQSIHAKRLTLLANQLKSENDGVQERAAELLGLKPPHLSKILADPTRNVDLTTTDRVLAHFEPAPGMMLERRFFFDESLGDAPDYRRFMVPRDVTGVFEPIPLHGSPSPPPVPLHSGEGRLSLGAQQMLEKFATKAEKALLDQQVSLFRLPFLDETHIQLFLAAIREGKSALEATDEALDGAIDAADKKRDD